LKDNVAICDDVHVCSFFNLKLFEPYVSALKTIRPPLIGRSASTDWSN